MPGLAIIPLRWNVKRDVRASIGAYGGGNGAYERVFTEKMCRKQNFVGKKCDFYVSKNIVKWMGGGGGKRRMITSQDVHSHAGSCTWRFRYLKRFA